MPGLGGSMGGGSRPRPGGGFNAGLGQFNEHLDEQALQQAVGQKQLHQLAGSSQSAALSQGQGGSKAAQDLGTAEAAGSGGGLGRGGPPINFRPKFDL